MFNIWPSRLIALRVNRKPSAPLVLSRGLPLALLIGLFSACVTTPEKASDPVIESQLEGAVASERRGDYAAAVVQYQKLSLRLPDDIETHLGLARNLRYSGSPAEAMRVLNKMPAPMQVGPAYLLERAKAELATGKSANAIETLLAAVAKAPDDWENYSTLGIAYDMNDEFARARNAYDRAKQLSANNPAVLNNLAISMALSGDLEGAIRTLEDAPMVARHSAQMRQNLALFYGIKGDVAKAESLARIDLDDKTVRQNLEVYSKLRRN